MDRKHGLQSKLVRKTKICQSVMSDLFTGKRRPTPEQAAILEEYLLKEGFAITRFDMLYRWQKGQKLLSLDQTCATKK